MMGRQPKGRQLKMFYQGLNLERRVRPDHPLRRVERLVDFDFIYQEVAPTYGVNGNVSVPPPVILKLLLLLIFYNVRSERELMATLPERLDWLWFPGFDLDDDIPDHSVLSKARSRWGPAAFQHFFARIVCRCVEAGLVDGAKIFLDSSLIQADASNNSIIKLNSLKSQLNRHYQELEARLEELPADGKGRGRLNRTHLSATDPDASLVSQGNVRSQLSYKVHRAVDARAEVITATAVTSGAVNEGRLLPELIDQHTEHTRNAENNQDVKAVVADSRYGRSITVWNVMTGAWRRISLLSETAPSETASFLRRPSPMTRKTTSTSVPRGNGCNGDDTTRTMRHSNTGARAKCAGPAACGTGAPTPSGAEPSGAIAGMRKSASCGTGRSPAVPNKT
jgi:transposase